MPYFKDNTNNLHYLDCSSFQHLLPEGCVEISDEEAETLKYIPTLTYAEKRVLAYPPIQDYIDGIVKGDQEQIANYIAACLEVKEAIPKDI